MMGSLCQTIDRPERKTTLLQSVIHCWDTIGGHATTWSCTNRSGMVCHLLRRLIFTVKRTDAQIIHPTSARFSSHVSRRNDRPLGHNTKRRRSVSRNQHGCVCERCARQPERWSKTLNMSIAEAKRTFIDGPAILPTPHQLGRRQKSHLQTPPRLLHPATSGSLR